MDFELLAEFSPADHDLPVRSRAEVEAALPAAVRRMLAILERRKRLMDTAVYKGDTIAYEKVWEDLRSAITADLVQNKVDASAQTDGPWVGCPLPHKTHSRRGKVLPVAAILGLSPTTVSTAAIRSAPFEALSSAPKRSRQAKETSVQIEELI